MAVVLWVDAHHLHNTRKTIFCSIENLLHKNLGSIYSHSFLGFQYVQSVFKQCFIQNWRQIYFVIFDFLCQNKTVFVYLINGSPHKNLFVYACPLFVLNVLIH